MNISSHQIPGEMQVISEKKLSIYSNIEKYLNTLPCLSMCGWIYRGFGLDITELQGAQHERRVSLQNVLIFLLNCVIMSNSIRSYSFNNREVHGHQASRMVQLCIYLYHMHGCLFLLVTMWRARRIRTFLYETIAGDKLLASRKKVVIMSILWFMIIFTLNTMRLIYYSKKRFYPSRYPFLDHSVSWQMFISRLINFWDSLLINSLIVCISVYFLAFYLFTSWLTIQLTLLKSHLYHKQINAMTTLLHSVHQSHNDFEKIFNVYPMIWLSWVLFSVTYFLLTRIKRDSHPQSGFQFTLIAVETIAEMVLLIAVILYIAMASESFQEETRTVIEMLSSSAYENASSQLLLISNIHVRLPLKFTVWNTHEINRSLPISFIASLMTFSVLLVQIHHGALSDDRDSTPHT